MDSKKLIIYIDMDDTLCDYTNAYKQSAMVNPDVAYPQSIKGFYQGIAPLPGGVETFHWLSQQSAFDVYILTAPSLRNPHSYSEKRQWVETHLGYDAVERLIISPHKHLNKGHFLVDDKTHGKGQDKFSGQLIEFGSKLFPDWQAVRHYFQNILNKCDAILNPVKHHPDILCFRVFDLRNRFEQPVATFREALELLQSDSAYMPESDSDIICYLKNGQSITIPEQFYIVFQPRFKNYNEAKEWVLKRDNAIKEDRSFAKLLGMAIANPDLPIEQQIKEALSYTQPAVIDVSENDRVCQKVDEWLSVAIDALPKDVDGR